MPLIGHAAHGSMAGIIVLTAWPRPFSQPKMQSGQAQKIMKNRDNSGHFQPGQPQQQVIFLTMSPRS